MDPTPKPTLNYRTKAYAKCLEYNMVVPAMIRGESDKDYYNRVLQDIKIKLRNSRRK